MTAKHTAIREIMEGVEALRADPIAKEEFRRLVCSVSAAHGLTWARREERIAFARALLAKNVSRATIRDRLRAHYSISSAQAYRVIGCALQLSQKSPKNETRPVFNGPVE